MLRKRLSFLVHVFTACGAWAGLEACLAISQHQDRRAFLYMFLAVAIDSVDGSLARLLKVNLYQPHIDGRRLDDMVDYFTWVVTPVFFMVHSGVIGSWAPLWALPLVCSALGMAHLNAKTEDDFFLGFPSLWNVVALYLWKGGLPSDCNSGIVVAFSLAVLAPIRFIYPSKTRPYRSLTMVWMSAWLLLTTVALVCDSPFGNACFLASLTFPIYYLGLSLLLNFAGKSRGPEGASGTNGN